MVLAVVALDVVALFIKRQLLVDAWPMNRRILFTAVWMIATLAVVGTSLVRIRAARVRARPAPGSRSSGG